MKLITLFQQLFHRDLRSGYYILGIEKCGTTSLEKYLKSQGFHVVREESNYCRWFGVIKFKYQYPNMKAVMIIRDPVERIWSHYNYKHTKQFGDRHEIKCELKEALIKYSWLVDGSNYSKWIKKWESVNPIIYKLEELCLLSDFPKENTTHSTIPKESRKLIVQTLTSTESTTS